MIAALRALGLGLVMFAACASASLERREYILAHPHGWVELTIADAAVPDVPIERDGRSALERPRSCGVEVALDRESFVSSWAYPVGEVAPYAVRSGFRFPAPVGAGLLRVEYGGCRAERGEPRELALELPIEVREGQVSEVIFDGAALAPRPLRPNAVITLEDVYRAVTGGRPPTR